MRYLIVAGILAIGLLSSSASAASMDAAVESRANAVSAGIGSLTGLAISPVLVLGIFGFLHWWNAPADATMPLFAQPWLWAPLLVVWGLATLAKTGSLAIPGSKYLLDAPKQFHSKAMGLMAGGLFLPTVCATLAAAGVAIEPPSGVQTAGLGSLAIVPIVVFLYLSVWIVSNTLDALVFLSPFAIVDAVLLSFRGIVLSLVLGATAIDHWIGIPLFTIIVCGPILIVCLLIAAPCVRLNLFAFLCAWDFLTRRRRRTRAEEGRIRAFVASGHIGVPVRTMGHVEPAEGVVRFEYRPLFVLPARRIDVPAQGPMILRGVIWSAITVEHGGTRRAAFSLPPRYLGHEPVLASRFGASIEDGLVRRGIRGTIAFVRSMFGLIDRTTLVAT